MWSLDEQYTSCTQVWWSTTRASYTSISWLQIQKGTTPCSLLRTEGVRHHTEKNTDKRRAHQPSTPPQNHLLIKRKNMHLLTHGTTDKAHQENWLRNPFQNLLELYRSPRSMPSGLCVQPHFLDEHCLLKNMYLLTHNRQS